jgi:hypothetical protein
MIFSRSRKISVIAKTEQTSSRDKAEKIIRALSASEINAEGDFERILTPRGTATALFASMSN